MPRIRKPFRVILLAAIVTGFVVPVGFALSLKFEPPAVVALVATLEPAGPLSVVASQIVVETSSPNVANEARPITAAVKLFAAGTLLLGLAAAVKKRI